MNYLSEIRKFLPKREQWILDYNAVIEQLQELDGKQIADGISIDVKLPQFYSSPKNYRFDKKTPDEVIKYLQDYIRPAENELFNAQDTVDSFLNEENHRIKINIRKIVFECGTDRIIDNMPFDPKYEIMYRLLKKSVNHTE